LSRHEPLSELYNIQVPEHDQEGRVVGLEFKDFYLINVYVPNSGSELKRLEYRKSWDKEFLKYIHSLNQKKPVILAGDLNVAREKIDLARPDSNYNKTAGFTQTEIDGIDAFINDGFVDSFRKLHPEEIKYTFWNQRFRARDRNVGWRIDYFLVGENLKEKIYKAEIFNDIMGSDHCPIGLELVL